MTLPPSASSYDAPVIALFGPAGTGKTSAMRRWHSSEGTSSSRECVWIDAPSPSTDLAGDAVDDRVVFVDDAHLSDPATVLPTIDRLISTTQLPSQVVIAGRFNPGLPLGRRRVRGEVVDLDESDLRLDAEAITSIASEQMTSIDESDVEHILGSTEGWALAALEMVRRWSDETGPSPAGADAVADQVADLLVDRFTRAADEQTIDVVVGCSLLDEITHDAAEFITGDPNPIEVIERARRGGLHAQPVDRNHASFRLHPLIRRGLVRYAQRQIGHDEFRELQLRTAEWCAENGLHLAAAQHALDAGAHREAADLLSIVAVSDREPLDAELLSRASVPELEEYPPLVLATAWFHASRRDTVELERCLETLDAARWDGLLPSGHVSLATAVEEVRGMLPALTSTENRRAIRLAEDTELDIDGTRTSAIRYHAAHQKYMEDRVRDAFDDAVDLARGHRALAPTDRIDQTIIVLAVDLQALIHHDRGQTETAAARADHSATLVQEYDLEPLYFAAAQVHDLAQALCGRWGPEQRVERLQRLIDDAPHTASRVHAGIEQARLLDRIGDLDAARRSLATVIALGETAAEWPLLARRLSLLKVALDPTSTPPGTYVPITPGERALFRLLPSELTQDDIADSLGISVNTIKSQLRSIYQKFGVSSRGDAVAYGVRTGLLASVMPWEHEEAG